MKKLFFTIIVCFILCISFSLNSFASGVGTALEVVQGSGIDPRTNGTYKDKFEFPFGSDDTCVNALIERGYKYCDLVFTSEWKNGNKIYYLKRYWRIYYPSDCKMSFKIYTYNTSSNPEVVGQYTAVVGNNIDVEPVVLCRAVEKTDGTFDVSQSVMSCKTSNFYSYYQADTYSIDYCDAPMFNDIQDAIFYNNTGTVRNAYYDTSPKDYLGELYFKSFEVIPHVSNRFDAYYFDIKYELSDYAKKHINALNLNFENKYLIKTQYYDGGIGYDNQDLVTEWKANSISLKDNPYGFTIFLNDINSIDYAIKQWGLRKECIIGDLFAWDITNSILPFDVVFVNGSFLYFKFNLRFNSDNGLVVGKRNDFTYDVLNKTVDKYIYTPNVQKDPTGTTTFVTDTDGNITYTQEGDTITSGDYYYNKVTETNEGDEITITNNFYYYDKDGNEKEISKDEYDNNFFTIIGGNTIAEGGSASVGNINIDIDINSGEGEYVSISPVDFNQFVKALKEMLDEFDTKGGLFELLKDTFGFLPEKVNLIWCGSIAGMFIISVICILRKR